MDALKRISCRNFVAVDGYAYFSNWFYNGLFKVELCTGRTFFLGSFEGEKLSEGNVHREIFERDGKIYFCPLRGRQVHIYDLQNQRIQAIEIRKNTEGFFRIKEVVVGRDCVFFIAETKKFPIRRLDLNSLKMAALSQEAEIYGIYLSSCKEKFPASALIKECQIERGDRFFWRQLPDRRWYGFLPEGRQLLRYTEGTDKIEKIPLRVVNEERLERYLYEIKTELWKEGVIFEDSLGIGEFLKGEQPAETRTQDGSAGRNCIGESIWKAIRESV